MDNKNVVVSFKDASKKYLTGPKYYPSLRDWVGTLFSKEFFKGKESFFALYKLTLDIYQGEAVGFIGANGAGKSTVLKLISRVIVPTYGTVEVKGKTAGLLELGAGFHPELSGRENIFFQGIILGMEKNEIQTRTKEIIDFAHLGDFIDSPVKHFSSGMYARLGFSVAIHLDCDILLIDEVLAVGDAEFKEKCYERIERYLEDRKKTVILVSHDMQMLKRLCQRIFWLDKGKVVAGGKPNEVIKKYLNSSIG